MDICLYRPLTPEESNRLFANAFLSTSHDSDKQDTEFSLFSLIDFCIGLIRLPYFLSECKKIYQEFQKRGLWVLDGERLGALASGAEIAVWGAERGFIVLGGKTNSFLQGVCYLSRTILYEGAVYQEGLLLMKYRRGDRGGLEQKKLQVQLIAHTASLAWVSLTLARHVFGLRYPDKMMQLLHVTSLIFGGIAACYEPMPPFLKEVLKDVLPFENGAIC